MMRATSRSVAPAPRAAWESQIRCRIERFSESQIPELFAIESLSFGEDSYREEFFRTLCRDNRELLLVARGAGRILGYVMGEWQSGGAEVISVAVHPDFRGQGLGRKLMQRLLDLIHRQGGAKVWLMVRADNTVAINLYRSMGFRRVRRVPAYYMDGQDAIRMKLEMGPAAPPSIA